jgi:Mor family transcriptional regulator
VASAKKLVLFIIYGDRERPPIITNEDRDTRIRQRYASGDGLSDLARAYGISPQRVFQIVKPNRSDE